MTSYFVANAGVDTNNGTSSATPIKTILKLNSLTLNSGDTVLFNRGDSWNTVTDAAPTMRTGVTYGAYGAAAVLEGSGFTMPMPTGSLKVNDWVSNAPVLDAGAPVTGWSTYTGGASDNYVSDNFSSVVSGADLSTSVPQTRATSDVWTEITDVSGGHMIATPTGTIRRANVTSKSWYWFRGGPNQPAYFDYYVKGTFTVASLLTTDFCGVLARISPSSLGDGDSVEAFCDRNGNITLAVNNNAAQTPLGTTTTTLTVGGTVTLEIDVQGPTASLFVNGTLAIGPVGFGNSTEGQFALAGGSVGMLLGSGSSTSQTDTTGFQATNFSVGPLNDQTTPTVATYQAALAADAGLYTLRNVILEAGQGPNILLDGQYAWLNGVLYVATTGGAPGSTDVVAGAGVNVIAGGTAANVTLSGITLRHSSSSALSWGAATGLTLDGLQVENAASQIDATRLGAVNLNGATNITIKNCVIRSVSTDAVRMQSVVNHTITQNRFGPVVGSVGNIVVHLGLLTTTYNGVYANNYSTYLPKNFSVKGHYLPEGQGFTFTNCYMEGANFGIATIGGSLVLALVMTGNMFYDIGIMNAGPGGAIRLVDNVAANFAGVTATQNLIMECPAGIVVAGTNPASTRGVTLENNTIINVATAPLGLTPAMLQGGAGYQVNILNPAFGTFKNNILWNASGSGLGLLFTSVAGGQTWVSDSNLIGPESTGFINYGGTAFNTLAAYVASKSQDANSIKSDPKFAAQGGALNAASYGLTYRSPARNAGVTATNTAGSWGNPDMGAIEFYVGFWGVPT